MASMVSMVMVPRGSTVIMVTAQMEPMRSLSTVLVLSEHPFPRSPPLSKSLLPQVSVIVVNALHRGPRGHVGRPMTPPKLMYFCGGMPEEPKIMEQSCPDCFFR